jgi:FkbM family methyltransferase
VLRELHPAKTAFCDVGAHFGFYSVWMSDVASKVYAFEPDPRLHPALHRNLGTLQNSTVCPVALTKESGRVSFIQAESAPHSKIGGAADDSLAGKRIEVVALSLDEFWVQEGRPVIGSMKMDTEGHEVAVFAGGEGCLRACRPLILVETDATALSVYWGLFEKLGYRLGLLTEKVSGQKTECHFGRSGDFLFTDGMLFLVPPTITEAQFRAEVGRL